jgi:hypothetical protein
MQETGSQEAGVRSQEAGGGSQEAEVRSEPNIDAPKDCEKCSRWREVRRKIRVAELLGTAVTKLRARFDADDFKPSVADYLKLMELEEELKQSSDTVKEIKVTWVEAKESDSEK